ncbi:MAG: serpin family protein [Candidatus Caldatribacteriaceae bacterium]
MKRWFVVSLIFCVVLWGSRVLLAQKYSIELWESDFLPLSSADVDFGFQLFTRLSAEEEKNLVISPYSVASILRLTCSGARGETKGAMAKVLGIDALSMEEVNRGNAVLFKSLQASVREDPSILLSLAFSLWVKKGVHFQPSFLTLARDFYNAEVENLDFSLSSEALGRINSWVKEKTGGKIARILERIDPQTIMVLCNAVHFQGLWQEPFDPERTKPMPFVLPDGTEKECLMMSTTGEFPYLEEEAFQAVGLPYGTTGRLGMYVFLPRGDHRLEDFLLMLGREKWEEWMSRFEKREGMVFLPRFRVEYGGELQEVLKVMGMGVAFGSGADFGGLVAGPAWISRVLHKAVIEVEERGTEAAATTAVVIVRGGVERFFRFMANRPFFFAIWDNTTKTILFLGCVVDPGKNGEELGKQGE